MRIMNLIGRIGKLGLCSILSIVLILVLALCFFLFSRGLSGLEGFVAFWEGFYYAIHLVAIISLIGLIFGLISFIQRKSWLIFFISLINLIFLIPSSFYIVKFFFQRVSDPNQIHAAVQKRDIKQVQKLLDRGFDINYCISDNYTPLNRAAIQNDMEMVKFLISKGARVDDVSGAVACGNVAMIQLLFEKGAKVSGFSTAVEKRNIDIIKLLLDYGANVNEVVPNNNGRTILHNAIGTNPEIVELLISHGADVNALDNDHRTPLHCLAESYFPQDWQSKDHIQKVAEILLAAGANIEAKTYDNKTPLASAAEHAGMSQPNGAITVLIQHGADINNVVDQRNHLIAASYALSPEELAVWFRNNIKNVNAINRYYSPLICSITRGAAPAAIELLIQADANLNATDGENRNTPLHWAALKGRIEVAELLIRGGADINKQNRWGYTPLHMPTLPTIGEEARGIDFDTQIIELLLRNGARLDITDIYGRTVLDKYTSWLPQTEKGRQYQKKVIELLEKYKATSGNSKLKQEHS